MLVLVLAVVVLGMRVLEEKDAISCQWFRDHLGSVGTAIFGEGDPATTTGNIIVEDTQIM